MSDKPLEPNLFNRANNRGVIKLLLVVEIVAARTAGCVEMPDAIDILADVIEDVPFHAVHVVDIEKQLDAFASDALNKVDAPSGRVGHVILVIL